jgi:CheY-like chemotaxis protein
MSRILVVEDHEPLLAALQTMLKQMQHEVVPARNGREALNAQAQLPADILLTDIFMPEMDGFEVIRRFRQSYPTVKIIAMTGGGRGNPGGPYLGMAEKFGARWLLPKPFTWQQLDKLVRAAATEPPLAES